MMNIDYVLGRLRNVCFHDIDYKLNEFALESFKEFIKSRDLLFFMFNGDRFILDVELLNYPINMDCFNCIKYNANGCCCGQPQDMSFESVALFKEHSIEIMDALRSHVGDERYRALLGEGILFDRGINAVDGVCAFLIEDSGRKLCLLRKFAIDNDLSFYDLAPLSCLMFPLEILTLYCHEGNYYYYITSICDEYFWDNFARWGNYKHINLDMKCLDINKHGGKDFLLRDYKPLYKDELLLDVLSHEFGQGFDKKLTFMLERRLECE